MLGQKPVRRTPRCFVRNLSALCKSIEHDFVFTRAPEPYREQTDTHKHAPEPEPEVGHVGLLDVVALRPRPPVVRGHPVLLAGVGEPRVQHAVARNLAQVRGAQLPYLEQMATGRELRGGAQVVRMKERKSYALGRELKKGMVHRCTRTRTRTLPPGEVGEFNKQVRHALQGCCRRQCIDAAAIMTKLTKSRSAALVLPKLKRQCPPVSPTRAATLYSLVSDALMR